MDSRCVCFGWKSKGIKHVILLLTALWRSTARVSTRAYIGFYSSYEGICQLFRSNGIMHAQINWIETAQIRVIVLSWLKTKSQIRFEETLALHSLTIWIFPWWTINLVTFIPIKLMQTSKVYSNQWLTVVSFNFFFFFLHSNCLLKVLWTWWTTLETLLT